MFWELPTASSSAAFGPIPEKRTMQPSGTAPKMGNTTLPTVQVLQIWMSFRVFDFETHNMKLIVQTSAKTMEPIIWQLALSNIRSTADADKATTLRRIQQEFQVIYCYIWKEILLKTTNRLVLRPRAPVEEAQIHLISNLMRWIECNRIQNQERATERARKSR